MISLYEQLLNDIHCLGIKIDFSLDLKPFSKSYLGRYFIKSSKVRVYVYENKLCTFARPYGEILFTLIHEVIHHIQHKNPYFVRAAGVMHNEQFHRLNNHYRLLAREMRLTERRCYIDKNEIQVTSD